MTASVPQVTTKLLIVDQSPSQRASYIQNLRACSSQSYCFLEANSAAEGLDLWLLHHPDVVLLDLQLPDRGGFAFLERVGAHEVGVLLPVITLSEQLDGHTAVQAMKLGAADHLLKADLSASSLAASVQAVCDRAALAHQLQRSQQQASMIADIALHIRQYTTLDEILSVVVQDVREFLAADRVVVYQFAPDMAGTIVAEAVVPPWRPSLHDQVTDTCFQTQGSTAYQDGHVSQIDDIQTAHLNPCYRQLLERFQVRANLAVPILLPNTESRVWGLVVVHQCSAPRQWDETEVRLLQRLAVQVAIAIQQATLYESLQALNASLEQQVQERTHALAASEQKFRGIFNHTAHLMAILSPEGRVLDINQTALDFHQIALDEGLHGLLWEQPCWGNAPGVREQVRGAIAQAAHGESIRYETEILDAHGQLIPIDVSIRPLRNDAGQVVQLLAEGRDIRAAKQVESLLRLQAHVLDQIRDAVIATDLDGTIQTWNQGAERLYGYTAAEVLGHNVSQVYAPAAALADLIYAPLKTHDSLDLELQAQTKDGRLLDIGLRITKVLDEQGVPIRLIGCSNDITARKQAEASLQASETTNRAILQAIPDLLIRTTRQGEYREMLSGGSVRKVLMPPSPTEPCTARSILPEPIAKKRMEAIEQALQTGTIQIYEQQLDIDGELCWEEVRVSPLDAAEVLVMVRDITARKQAEEKLRQSEARYRAMIAAMPDLLIRVDAAGIHLDFFIPQRPFNLISPGAEVHGKHLSYMLPPHIAEQQWAAVQRALQTNELQVFEQQLDMGDRLQYEEVRVICTDDNEVLLIIRDITDRKQAELELHQLNQDLEAIVERRTQQLQKLTQVQQAILDGTDYAIISTDLHGVVQTFNRGAERMLGYRAEEVIDQATSNLFHDPQEIQQCLSLLGAPPHPNQRTDFEALFQYICQGAPLPDMEWTLIRKDGCAVPVMFSVTLLKDADENVTGALAMAKDISARKQAEQKLQESQRLIQQIADASPNVVYLYDIQEQRVVYLNRGITTILGVTTILGEASEQQLALEAHFLQEYIHPEDYALFLAHHEALRHAQDGDILTLEYRLQHVNGEWLWFYSRDLVFQRDNQGQARLIIGAAQDITERKQAEAQLLEINAELTQATRLKDEFLATMSHELRTPLNAILGMSEALQEELLGSLNDRQVQALGAVEQSGRHLLALINDILDLSKISSGNMELHPEVISLNELCEASLLFVRQQAVQKTIQLTQELPLALKGVPIRVDPLRMRQVLINLLTNAVKFTHAGGQVRLAVTLQRGEGEDLPPLDPGKMDGWLVLHVVDTGIGIAPQDMERLFQPFVQIDSRLNRTQPGTGLGLALVKRIVEMHGGHVRVMSKPGQGSCFTVLLPYDASLTLSMLPTPILPSALGVADLSVAIAPRVLLAEDNDINVATFKAYLTARHYEVIHACNGAEAYEFAKTHQPHIILMDVQMPGMDGLEAIRRIRADAAVANIPIIALTALTMPGDRERCLEAGATEYLSKPVSLRQLVLSMQTILKQAQRPSAP